LFEKKKILLEKNIYHSKIYQCRVTQPARTLTKNILLLTLYRRATKSFDIDFKISTKNLTDVLFISLVIIIIIYHDGIINKLDS